MESVMELTRKQFEILLNYIDCDENLTQRKLESLTGYSLGTINRVMNELSELKYVDSGHITDKGLEAMEPFRCRRAVFIAAGFGSRMVPITLNTPKPLIRVHGLRIIDRLIDACLAAGINEIYIVRGYLSELFDQLHYKYPEIKFLENKDYNIANNISSALVARNLLANSYVFESDLILFNPGIIKKYQYTSNYYGIKKTRTDDWCVRAKNGIIVEEKIGGEGDDIWQMVGISYWNEKDGIRLQTDIPEVYEAPGGKERYWEQVPLVFRKEKYSVEIFRCFEGDIVEVDSFAELKAIDPAYSV